MHHRDRFDQLLISEATAEDLTLVTADTRIMRYEVDTILAR